MTTEEKCDIIIAMLDEQKSSGKNQKSQQMDFYRMEHLSGKLEESIKAASYCTARMESVIEEAHRPVVRERKITIDIVSKETFFIFIGMTMIIWALIAWLYFATRPDYDRDDNDLKYRYIKMKSEASPQRTYELEDLFEINRDNARIKQLRKDVKDYEKAVKDKIILEEQTRLRQLETQKLNQKVNAIKEK